MLSGPQLRIHPICLSDGDGILAGSEQLPDTEAYRERAIASGDLIGCGAAWHTEGKTGATPSRSSQRGR